MATYRLAAKGDRAAVVGGDDVVSFVPARHDHVRFVDAVKSKSLLHNLTAVVSLTTLLTYWRSDMRSLSPCK